MSNDNQKDIKFEELENLSAPILEIDTWEEFNLLEKNRKWNFLNWMWKSALMFKHESIPKHLPVCKNIFLSGSFFCKNRFPCEGELLSALYQSISILTWISWNLNLNCKNLNLITKRIQKKVDLSILLNCIRIESKLYRSRCMNLFLGLFNYKTKLKSS